MDGGMKNYYEHLRMKEAREGHNSGRLNIKGWKVPSKKVLVQMYRDGRITYDQVGRAQSNLKRADHIEALKHGKVKESDLEALGIFIYSRQTRSKIDPSGGRVVQKAKVKQEDWSRSSAEIQQIMREHEARQAVKQAAEAKGKKGFEPTLTEKEKLEMLKRHQNKGISIIK